MCESHLKMAFRLKHGALKELKDIFNCVFALRSNLYTVHIIISSYIQLLDIIIISRSKIKCEHAQKEETGSKDIHIHIQVYTYLLLESLKFVSSFSLLQLSFPHHPLLLKLPQMIAVSANEKTPCGEWLQSIEGHLEHTHTTHITHAQHTHNIHKHTHTLS